MFYIIENWKFTDCSTRYIERAWCITIQRELFTVDEQKRMNAWALVWSDWVVEDNATIQKNLQIKEIDETLRGNFKEFNELSSISVRTTEQQNRYDYMLQKKTELETLKYNLINS